MNLTIIYNRLTDRGGRDWLRLQNVESIRLVKKDQIETKTFGNDPVIQRDIWEFNAEYKAALDYGPTDDRPCSECGAVSPEPHADDCTNTPELADSTQEGPVRTINLTPSADGFERMAVMFIEELTSPRAPDWEDHTPNAERLRREHVMNGLLETVAYLGSLPDGAARIKRLTERLAKE